MPEESIILPFKQRLRTLHLSPLILHSSVIFYQNVMSKKLLNILPAKSKSFSNFPFLNSLFTHWHWSQSPSKTSPFYLWISTSGFLFLLNPLASLSSPHSISQDSVFSFLFFPHYASSLRETWSIAWLLAVLCKSFIQSQLLGSSPTVHNLLAWGWLITDWISQT